MSSTNATIKTDQTLYLLLGEQAVDSLQFGIEEFKNDIKKQQFDFQLAVITDGYPLNELLYDMDGYFGYSFIEEEQYKELSKILQKRQQQTILFNKKHQTINQ